jgi:putative transposase
VASADLLVQVPLAQACATLELGRGSYYRGSLRERGAPRRSAPEGEALLAAIEAVVLEFPGYGYPRVTRHLQRAGWHVNHKRVRRLMGEAGLLQIRPRGVVRTTNSEHGWPVYPNLLADCGWRQLTRPDAAWGADLTYVR